jgi:hypothetical protein
MIFQYHGEILPYSPVLVKRIQGMEDLQGGARANYLEVIHGKGKTLIAKSWRWKVPSHFEMLIKF